MSPRLAIALVAALLFAAAFAPQALAANFDVDSTADFSDGDPGDGVCFAPRVLACTLRAAINEANALDGPDSIRVPAGDYVLSGQVLDVTSDVTILGASARSTVVRQFVDVEFGANDRVFEIGAGASVNIRRITIRDGEPNVEATDPGRGGNIYNLGTLGLREVTVADGIARSGGGIANVGGALTIELSTLTGNFAGGVEAAGVGGAIYDAPSRLLPDPVTIDTSTISGNVGTEGAGIYINSGATLNLLNSTIASNDAADRGGGLSVGSGDAKVFSSILADNTAKVHPTTPNCATGESGSIDSAGFNIETFTDCGFDQATDQRETDPALGALADNGGQTDTHALPAASPAVDAGDPSCVGIDQRRVTRPQGKACDVGAFELAAAVITGSDPPSPSNVNTPRIKGTATDGSTVRLYTNATCTSAVAATGTAADFADPGLLVNVPANTTRTFRATATDAAGNVSPCSAPFSYIEDSIAPDAPTITSFTPPTPANNNQPEVKGVAEEGSRVRLFTNGTCTGTPVVPSEPASVFANPGITVTVANNTRTTFWATATDAAGNVSLCSAPRAYTEDSLAPDATITSGPEGTINDATPTFGFTSNESGSTFQCRVDSQPFATCTSEHTTGALGDGPHTFQVRARDPAGNLDSSPADRDFTVETSAPETTIGGGPSGPTNDSTPTFTFGSNESGSSFQCRIDSAPFASCSSPYTPASALADGPHTFEVVATDAAGNADPTSAKRSFTLDTQPPETEITSGPPEQTTDSTPTFEFSSNEPGSTFECSIDDAPFAPCTSPFTTPTLGSGAHKFVVRAIDPSGNVDVSPAIGFDTQEFTLIGQAPGPPSLGRSFNVEELSGDIYVSVPAQTTAARAQASQVPPGYQSPIKGRVFVPLEEVRQLPIGSFVDTRFGTSQLTSARNRRGRTQAGKFSLGVFQVLQSRARRAKGLTEIRLKGGSFRSCRAGKGGTSSSADAAQVRRRRIRRVRSNTSGRWKAGAKNSAGTSRGTVWITTDRCDGTLTTVKRGKVAVRDFRRKKTILVRAGKSYLAKARR